MKNLLFVLVMLVAINGNAQWVWQNPLPQGNDLQSIFFINENTGWAAGDKGSILKTTDSGNNWIEQQCGRAKNLRKIYFINANTGFALSDTSVYYKTTNGGINWNYNTFGGNIRLNDTYFINQNTGFISGKNFPTNNGTIFRTTDSGNNWVGCFILGGDVEFSRIDFVNDNFGRISGMGYFFYTTNSGVNWSSQNNFFAPWDFDFSDSLNGLANEWAMTLGYFYKTTNGGTNFTLSYSSNNNFKSIVMVNSNIAYCVGENGLILKTSNFGTNWNIQNSGTTINLNKTYFIDSLKGWIVGDRGIILKTTNGGMNWITVSNGIYKIFTASSFVNPNTGWICGTNTIIKTTNGGNNWTEQWNSEGGLFNDVSFLDLNTGYITNNSSVIKTTNSGLNWILIYNLVIPGYYNPLGTNRFIHFINETTGWIGGTVYHFITGHEYRDCFFAKTVDGGLNWFYNLYGTPEYFLDMDFADLNTGWVVGTCNFVKKTTDAGTTWIDQTGLSGTGYSGISVVNNNIVYLIGWYNGSNTYISKTTNGGINWTGQVACYGSHLWYIKFVNENTGWISGANGMLLATSNGGVNWVCQITPTFESLNINFVNESTGWLIGENSAILKTTSGVLSGLKIIPESISHSYVLHQNYPNPFNPRTKIKFNIAKLGDVKIVVYDVMGREVQTLVNESLKPGTYEALFDGSQFTSGVYFYKLITNGFTETKRMLLIK